MGGSTDPYCTMVCAIVLGFATAATSHCERRSPSILAQELDIQIIEGNNQGKHCCVLRWVLRIPGIVNQHSGQS